MMPYVFCAIPVVAFLYAELKWLFRVVMASLIFLQVAFGIYNARRDHVCSYAGDTNPLLASFAEEHHIRPDFAIPIFSQDLNLNGGTAAIQLIVGIGVMLAILLCGVVVAQLKGTEAQTVRSENV